MSNKNDGGRAQREFEAECADDSETREGMANVGKHAAGRLLDGREWSEFPDQSANQI